MIACRLCGQLFKSITESHLQNTHSASMVEYREIFPDDCLTSRGGKTLEEIHGDRAKLIRTRLSNSHKGIIPTQESLEKRRKSMLGKNKGKLRIPRETRNCACGCNNTFVCLATSKKKYINTHQSRGKVPAIKGKTYIQAYGIDKANKIKNRQSKNSSGKLNPQWKDGATFGVYSSKFNRKLKELIRERDNYCCQVCNKAQTKNGRKLPVHHIDYDKNNSDPKNLTSLCNSCHSKTNSGKRKYWIEFFKLNLRLRVVG